MHDGESARAGGKPSSYLTPGCAAIRSLVQRFDAAGGGNRESRPGRDDGPTVPGSERASRSRSLAARWASATPTDILLPSKPRWMTTKLDKTNHPSQVADLDRQRQVTTTTSLAMDVVSCVRGLYYGTQQVSVLHCNGK